MSRDCPDCQGRMTKWELQPAMGFATVFPIGRDHLDAVLLFQGPVQRIGIVRLVAGQPCRQFVEEAA